jgi:hypothetical protein
MKLRLVLHYIWGMESDLDEHQPGFGQVQIGALFTHAL